MTSHVKMSPLFDGIAKGLRRVGSQRSSLRTFVVTLLLGTILAYSKPIGWVDRIWTDLLLVNQRKIATREIVIIDVDAHFVLRDGGERLSKEDFSIAMEKIILANPVRVLVDFNLGNAYSVEQVKQLQRLFSQLGPDRLAFGYEPDRNLRIKPELLSCSTEVDLQLGADTDGRFRRFITEEPQIACDPAAWLANGLKQGGETQFDLRIDPETFERIGIAELLSDRFDSSKLTDKRVIFSYNRTLSRSRANLPVHGPVDRSSLLAIGTQSQIESYSKQVTMARWLTWLSFLAALAYGFRIGYLSPSLFRAAFGFLLLGMVVFAFALLGVIWIGAQAEPATALAIAWGGIYTALASRLRLTELLAGFMAGDLSPEEVWLWRSKGENTEPVLLFDALGRVKRANHAAYQLIKKKADAPCEHESQLAALCMPSMGQRSEQVVTEFGERKVWQLAWPSPHLPLVVMRDVTNSFEQQEILRNRLITDPLTSVLNRLGFEEEIGSIEKSGVKDYAILFMDMNGFKQVNDQYGHEAGDSLLKIAAARFSAVLRPGDVLARLGGDEFGVLLRGSYTSNSVQRICEKIESTLDEKIDVGAAIVKVGVAVGYGIPQGATDTTKEVLHRADLGMYERKAFLKTTLNLPSR